MLEIVINENDKGQRVDKFLGKVMQNCTKSMIYKWIRLKKIKVNRKKCEINQQLAINDVVQFFIPHSFIKQQQADFLNAQNDLSIEYETDELLIVWKEKGLLMHPDASEKNDTLIQRALLYLYHTKQYDPMTQNSFRPATIHRLDRNTEGYVVIAKTYEALKNLNRLMQENTIQKKYVTIVENSLPQKQTLIHYHYKDESGKVYVSNEKKEGYKKMITEYRVIESYKNFNLIEVHLITGKSHQIRAQFGFIQHPIYGDKKYGSKYTADYQTLTAYELKFTYHEDIHLVKKDNTTTKLFQQLKNSAIFK